MELIIMLILMAATAALIVWPLLSRPEARSGEGALSSSPVPASKGHAALSAIKELEFDFATGKIAEDDYRMLRARYETKAVNALAEPPAARRASPDEALETEIRAARGRRFCTSCGTSLPSGARFCPSCGMAAEARA